jgi:hypothetical protein
MSDVEVPAANHDEVRGEIGVAATESRRGKTKNARRPIDLDQTTLSVLEAWRW